MYLRFCMYHLKKSEVQPKCVPSHPFLLDTAFYSCHQQTETCTHKDVLPPENLDQCLIFIHFRCSVQMNFYFNMNEPASTQAVIGKITDHFGFNETKYHDLTKKLNCYMFMKKERRNIKKRCNKG